MIHMPIHLLNALKIGVILLGLGHQMPIPLKQVPQLPLIILFLNNFLRAILSNIDHIIDIIGDFLNFYFLLLG